MNGPRGEVELETDGRAYCLCLTLGALAEIERIAGAGLSADLPERLTQLDASQLCAVLAALLRGGGEVDAARDIKRLPIGLGDAARGVAAAFEAALGPETP